MIKLKTNDWIIENIDTVLFDKDGTFVDLDYFWGKITELRVLEIINYFNLEQDLFGELCYYLGYDTDKKKMIPDGITALYSRVKIIEIFTDKLNNIGIKATNKNITEIFDNVNNLFNKNIKNHIKLIPEAIEFIKELYQTGTNLGIVTSDSTTTTRLTLELFDLDKYFKTVIGRESINETKESGKPTLLALRKLNANSKNTIMIGDAPMDYISAQNAGIEKTILVASGQVELQNLKKISNYTTTSLKEIKIIK